MFTLNASCHFSLPDTLQPRSQGLSSPHPKGSEGWKTLGTRLDTVLHLSVSQMCEISVEKKTGFLSLINADLLWVK